MFRIALGTALLALMSTAALGQSKPGTAGQEANLRGVSGVRLIVLLGHYGHRMEEAQKPEILKLVEADTAAKLKKAGIPYRFQLDPERPGDGKYAVLEITVTMSETEAPGPKRFEFENEVKLLQSVRLTRDPSIEFEAVTWLSGGSVTGPTPFVTNGTRDQVGDLIDGFVKDYFSANPKSSAASSSSKVIKPKEE